MTIGKEAAAIAGHPEHSMSMGKAVGLSMLGSTAAGVGTYQINTHIAKASKVPGPSLSLTTGGMPPASQGLAEQAHNVHKGYNRKHHKGGNRHGN